MTEPPAEPVDLSVVIVTWNALEVTAAGLESLRKHTAGIRYEVFVIDNGSTKDDSRTELPRRFPWVHFIANDANMGFTKANNQGIRRAVGRYVLLLNNDTIQTENALGEAVRYMDANPKVGALGIVHKNNDAEKSFQPSFFPFPSAYGGALALLGLGSWPAPNPAIVEQDVDWVVGSFLLMRRECLDQIGPLDERYFIYAEDIDWCLQAHRAGWTVRFWPGASMIHLGAAANPFMRDKSLVMYRSQVSYLRKNHSLVAAVAYYLAMIARLGASLALSIVNFVLRRVGRAEVSRRWNRLIQFLLLRAGRRAA